MTAPTYYIDYSDRLVDPVRKAPFAILPGELHTGTSLKLPGHGFTPYGEFIIEDMLHMLEHFASAIMPINPTVGQIWYDTSTYQLKVLRSIAVVGSTTKYDWDLASNNTTFSTTPPSNLTMLWYDVSSPLAANHTLKIYNTAAGAWQPVVPYAVQVSSTAPSSQKSLWFNTSNPDALKHELYAYNAGTATWRPAVSHDASMLTGTVPNSVLANSSIGGNAATATRATTADAWTTARTINLSTGAGGSVSFNGSADFTLPVTSLNANYITSGTVAVARLGTAGTRASGYYLDGTGVWLSLPPIPDAYTKTETNTLLSGKLGVNDTAANSNKLGGSTKTQVLADAYAQVGTMGKRDLYTSTADPVPGTGAVGDIWFKY